MTDYSIRERVLHSLTRDVMTPLFRQADIKASQEGMVFWPRRVLGFRMGMRDRMENYATHPRHGSGRRVEQVLEHSTTTREEGRR